MSGNLKILVHKSWHVWKRENREKVARDERNFKEDNERKEERERSLIQEKNLEILQQSGPQQLLLVQDGTSFAPNCTTEIAVEQPFRLFGDIEELDKKAREIIDQTQAKKDKELQDKKKSGEAPWALGEGAAEKIGSTVPYWYAKPSTAASRSSVKIKSEWGEKEIKEEKMMEREELRKNALDPMNGILKATRKISDTIVIGTERFGGEIIRIKEEPVGTSSQSYQVTSSFANNNNDNNNSKSSSGSIYRSVNHDYNDGHKSTNSDSISVSNSSSSSSSSSGKDKRKKSTNSNREKKNKRKKEDSDDDRHRSRQNINNSNSNRLSSSNSSSNSNGSFHSSSSKLDICDSDKRKLIKEEIHSNENTKDKKIVRQQQNSLIVTNINPSISLLRSKRLEREYIERKRAALVLAKVDIYGPPLDINGVSNLPDGREQRYNQQFHPNIAR